MRKPLLLLSTIALIFISSLVASAQNSITAAAAAGTLANLPESDTLIYLSPQRVLTVAAPRVMSAEDLARMRDGFAEMKKNVGLDPTTVDYLALAMRFKKPSADLKLQPPELLMVAKGDFNAEAIVTLINQAAGGKLRQEKYGAAEIGIITIDDIAKEAEQTPFLKSFSEVAIGSLGGDSIAIGNVNYVKAAIDAAGGKSRISADTLASLLRDPEALVSFAGSPLLAYTRTLGMLGTEASSRATKCDSKFGDFYAALTLDGNMFKLRGLMNADNPDTAQIITNLLVSLIDFTKRQMKDKAAQNMMGGLAIAAKENDVTIQANFPEKDVADFVRDAMRPKPATATAPAQETSPKSKTTRRPVHRRVRKNPK